MGWVLDVTWQGGLDAFAYAHLLGHLLTPPNIILQVPEARHLRPPLVSRPAVAEALSRRISPCAHVLARVHARRRERMLDP